MNAMGPVSALLERQLRERVRKHGVVVWLDLDDHYSPFLDRLLAQPDPEKVPYAVHAYRGSFLELLLALENEAAGLEPVPLVIHAPGFNEELIRHTPLLELYSAGVRFRKALPTLIREAAVGKLPTERIDAFLEQGQLTLAGADDWLASSLDAETGAVSTWLLQRGLNPALDDLLLAVADDGADAGSRSPYLNYLRSATGMPAPWQQDFAGGPGSTPADLAYAVAAWALCVEYVHDLKRPPIDARLRPAVGLPAELIEQCRTLCRHLRASHAGFYVSVSDDTAAWMVEEREQAQAHELGATDTFRFEEEVVLEAALNGLANGDWAPVLAWSAARIGGGSFWLRQDIARLSAWQLIEACAKLGAAIAHAGDTLGARTHAEAAARYVEVGSAVDRAHRHLEQQRLALLYPQIPYFDKIRAQAERVASLWQVWADAWAVGFNDLCRTEGFLPEPGLRQRTLFSQVVEPMLDSSGTTALFLIDALRFEMAGELFALLDGTPDSRVRLDARLAELPTITAVGMNALAPVERDGRLHPVLAGDAIEGFASGEFNVVDPKSRKRAMQSRVGGTTLPMLSVAEVLERSAASLKQGIARARLVVVFSLEIDEAGENGAGPASFESAIRRLRAVWRLLRDAGVRRFVITSDHGFLLINPNTAPAQRYGRKIDPRRRYVLSCQAADGPGEVRVPLQTLGYLNTDLHLVMPESTRVFDTGKRGHGFVHGGNSLQERMIPVLTSVHRHGTGVHTMRYAIGAQRLDDVAGMHCVSVKLTAAVQEALDFGGVEEVELAMRVPDDDAVQVDLCQVRGGARLDGAVLFARIDQDFEVFFRLTGGRGQRVMVELLHPSAEVHVEPCTVSGRFTVAPGRNEPARGARPDADDAAWLANIADEPVRRVFAHLGEHGVVTEPEVVQFLGNARAARRFSLKVEEHALHAPFAVRIEVVAGVKRYVKDGGAR